MIKITGKELCCGCAACANVCPQNCIDMVADEKGFLYPHIDESLCVNCGLCNKICPIINGKDGDGKKLAFAAYNTAEEVRKVSSSGGIFGILASEILRRNGVVFGATFEKDFKSVYHIGVESVEDLPKLYGSKYLQSEIRKAYAQVENCLKANRWVLFTGTSCQVAGLKAFLKKDYEKLITADVICHGVPSPKVWSDYATKKENEIGSEITGVAFRDKRCGWSKSVLLLLLFANGKESCELSSKDYYIKGFLSDLYLRDSCYECKFKGDKVVSDISLGDFWGIDKVLPNFNDEKGVSAVIVNTDKGESLFNDVKNALTVKGVTYGEVLVGNPALIKPCLKPYKSDKFWKLYNVDGLDKALKKSCRVSVIRRCYRLLRRILAKIWKLFRKRKKNHESV